MSTSKKLRPPQLRMLQNLADGKDSTYGLIGGGTYYAAWQTRLSLIKRGLIIDYTVTEAGHAALAGEKP